MKKYPEWEHLEEIEDVNNPYSKKYIYPDGDVFYIEPIYYYKLKSFEKSAEEISRNVGLPSGDVAYSLQESNCLKSDITFVSLQINPAIFTFFTASFANVSSESLRFFIVFKSACALSRKSPTKPDTCSNSSQSGTAQTR